MRRPTQPRAFSWWTWVMVGLAAGLVELGVVMARTVWMQDGLLRRSFHTIWMIPLSNLLVFAIFGILCVGISRLAPGWGSWWANRSLATLAGLAPLIAVPGLSASAALVPSFGAALWVCPFFERPERHPLGVRIRQWGLPLLVGIVGLLGVIAVFNRHGLSVTSQPRQATGGTLPSKGIPHNVPHVFLIVLDTVRADALNPRTMPRLQEFARRGATFQRAIATSPWTLPTHATLFTGRWSWELGVGPDRGLDTTFPTLAEELSAAGYATAGFVANLVFGRAEYGLGRGFSHYDDEKIDLIEVARASSIGWWTASKLSRLLDRALALAGKEIRHPLEPGTPRRSAREILQRVEAWMDRQLARQPERPVMVFVNLFDAHDPYLPPPEAPRRLRNRDWMPEEIALIRDWIGHTPRPRLPDEIETARLAYDECLLELDDRLGRFLDRLEEQGFLKNAVVIVTSDHGEHFGEHARQGVPIFGHRQSLDLPEIHVPLVIVAPKRIPAGVVVRDPVSLRDIPATLGHLTGLTTLARTFPGRSLFETATGDPRDWNGIVGRRDVLAEFAPRVDLPVERRYQGGAEGTLRAVLEGDAMLIRREDGVEWFYDLAKDPEQKHNRPEPDSWSGQLARTRLRQQLSLLAPVSTIPNTEPIRPATKHAPNLIPPQS